MRVTIVNRYFHPESVLVNDISRWLAADGHKVTVLTGQPDYNPEAKLGTHPKRETWFGVNIRRISVFRDTGRGFLRNINSLLFILLAAGRVLLGPKTDAVWSTSIPPIVQPLLLRLASRLRGAKFVYFPQDIYPEIASATGMMRSGWLEKILRKVDAWVLTNSDTVVTISGDMLDVIRERGGNPPSLSVIRSFSPVEQPRPEPEQKPEGPLRFVFAGNIGRFQNLDALLDAFATIDPKRAVLELLGDGREKARLQRRVLEENIETVRFHDFLPVEEAFDFTAACQIGVVSLTPNIYRYAFPAKFYTYIGAGLPMLVLVERESELAKIVLERDIGAVVGRNEEAEAAGSAINRLIDQYEKFQKNLYDQTDDLYLPEKAREKWVRLFRTLEKSNG